MTLRGVLRLRAPLAVFAIVAGLSALVPACAADARDRRGERIAALIASTDGATKESAYRVASTTEEYLILRARHLVPGTQSLIIGDDHHPYDMIEATDPRGATIKLWFDIASFYGREFGF